VLDAFPPPFPFEEFDDAAPLPLLPPLFEFAPDALPLALPPELLLELPLPFDEAALPFDEPLFPFDEPLFPFELPPLPFEPPLFPFDEALFPVAVALFPVAVALFPVAELLPLPFDAAPEDAPPALPPAFEFALLELPPAWPFDPPALPDGLGRLEAAEGAANASTVAQATTATASGRRLTVFLSQVPYSPTARSLTLDERHVSEWRHARWPCVAPRGQTQSQWG
jgi:hypothetical protein